MEAQAENGPVEVGGEVEATSRTTVRTEKSRQEREIGDIYAQRSFMYGGTKRSYKTFSSREHTITRFGPAQRSRSSSLPAAAQREERETLT